MHPLGVQFRQHLDKSLGATLGSRRCQTVRPVGEAMMLLPWVPRRRTHALVENANRQRGQSPGRGIIWRSRVCLRLWVVAGVVLGPSLASGQSDMAAILQDFNQKHKPPIVLAIDGLSPDAPVVGVATTTSYLGPDLKSSRNLTSINGEIKSFAWSGGYRRTAEALPDLRKFILDAMEVTRNDGRSLAVVTHSWGGVLGYAALRDLERTGQLGSGEISLFITIHTPLGLAEYPRNRNVVGPLLGLQASVSDSIRRYAGEDIRKPTSVARWRNYFSSRDRISTQIRGADSNEDTGQDHTGSHTDVQWLDRYALEVALAAGATKGSQVVDTPPTPNVTSGGLQVPPTPTSRVNDYVSALASSDRQRLERLLAEGEGATKAQMAVAIFRSLQGEKLEDYTLRVANQWGIGRAGVNDGVVLFIFMDDRKMRLEVGKGLEAVISNDVAAGILRDAVAPQLRQGRVAAGVEGAVKAVYARLAGRKAQTVGASEVPKPASIQQIGPAPTATPAEVLKSLAGRWQDVSRRRGEVLVWTIEEDGRYQTVLRERSGQEFRQTGKISVSSEGRIESRSDKGAAAVLTVDKDDTGAQIVRGKGLGLLGATFQLRRMDSSPVGVGKPPEAAAAEPLTTPTPQAPTTKPPSSPAPSADASGPPTTSLPPARMEITSCSGVKVTVPAGVDLTNDENAQRYIEEGRQYVLKNCRRQQAGFSLWIGVMVYQEGSTSFIGYAGQGVHCYWEPNRPCGPFENWFKLAKQREEQRLAEAKKAQEEKLQAQQRAQQEEQQRKQAMLDQLRASQPGVVPGARPTGVFFDVSPRRDECYNWVVIALGEADLTDLATVQKLIAETKIYAYSQCRFRATLFGTVLKTQMYILQQGFLPADTVPPHYGEWWIHSRHGTALQIVVDCARNAADADFQCQYDPRANPFLRVKENFERRRALYKQWGFRDELEGGRARIRDLSTLTANPYPYQGKTVVIETDFHRMTAPTEAMFGSGNDIIMLTNVPSDLFRQQGTRYIMAGRVVGTAEAALPIPMPGKVTVPKLSLIGAYLCRLRNCEDFWIPSR